MTDAKEPEVIAEIRAAVEMEAALPSRLEQYREILAVYATLTRERDEARVVTDAMVERAAKAWYQNATPYFWRLASQDTKRSFLSTARAALTAALTPEDA